MLAAMYVCIVYSIVLFYYNVCIYTYISILYYIISMYVCMYCIQYCLQYCNSILLYCTILAPGLLAAREIVAS